MGMSGTGAGRSVLAISGGNNDPVLDLLIVSGSDDMGKRVCLRGLVPSGLKGVGTGGLHRNFSRAATVTHYYGLLVTWVGHHIFGTIPTAVMPGQRADPGEGREKTYQHERCSVFIYVAVSSHKLTVQRKT